MIIEYLNLISALVLAYKPLMVLETGEGECQETICESLQINEYGNSSKDLYYGPFDIIVLNTEDLTMRENDFHFLASNGIGARDGTIVITDGTSPHSQTNKEYLRFADYLLRRHGGLAIGAPPGLTIVRLNQLQIKTI